MVPALETTSESLLLASTGNPELAMCNYSTIYFAPAAGRLLLEGLGGDGNSPGKITKIEILDATQWNAWRAEAAPLFDVIDNLFQMCNIQN
mgnify:CR=1 FL=1